MATKKSTGGLDAAERNPLGDAALNLGGALARVHAMLSAIERLSLELEDSAACGSGYELVMAVEACTEVALGLVVATQEHLDGMKPSAAAAKAGGALDGVALAVQLLRDLRAVDDADLDEVTRNQLCAEHFTVTLDLAQAGDGSRWSDFAKAVSYAMRISVGGIALEAQFDLRKLVKGLDGSPAGERTAEPQVLSSASRVSGVQA